MIIKKTWYTIKKNEKGIRTYPVDVRRSWVGYFLFGLIPLYIKQIAIDVVR
jgi:hypothetical protein